MIIKEYERHGEPVVQVSFHTLIKYLPVKFWFFSDNGFLMNFILNIFFHFYESLIYKKCLRTFREIMSEHLSDSSHTKMRFVRWMVSKVYLQSYLLQIPFSSILQSIRLAGRRVLYPFINIHFLPGASSLKTTYAMCLCI